jgi:hypothetical protein
MSADGRYVVFTSTASDLVVGDDNTASDVFVRDLRSGSTIRATVDTAGGDANNFSYNPSITADGRYVSFTSFATDLVTRDRNDTFDVFVRDLVLGRTIRVSQDQLQREANKGSFDASISADGAYVAFGSRADDLVEADDNGEDDVFVKYVRVLTVSAISPTTLTRGATDVAVTINGTGFEPGNAAQIHGPGNVDIALSNVTVASDNTIHARLSLPSDAPAGRWDVRVYQLDDPGFAIGQCSRCLDVT